jgi:hypothetical protein
MTNVHASKSLAITDPMETLALLETHSIMSRTNGCTKVEWTRRDMNRFVCIRLDCMR